MRHELSAAPGAGFSFVHSYINLLEVLVASQLLQLHRTRGHTHSLLRTHDTYFEVFFSYGYSIPATANEHKHLPTSNTLALRAHCEGAWCGLRTAVHTYGLLNLLCTIYRL